MENNFSHILFYDNEYIIPKKGSFDYRTKTGFFIAWNDEQAKLFLNVKRMKCLSVYGLEGSVVRDIVFERRQSTANILCFKYEYVKNASIENYYQNDIIHPIIENVSLREVTENIYCMLKDYQHGVVNFKDRIINEWLNRILSGMDKIEDKDMLEKALIKYVGIVTSKILWSVYHGNTNEMGKDISAIVYIFSEINAEWESTL